jgi:hypothetical protein
MEDIFSLSLSFISTFRVQIPHLPLKNVLKKTKTKTKQEKKKKTNASIPAWYVTKMGLQFLPKYQK